MFSGWDCKCLRNISHLSFREQRLLFSYIMIEGNYKLFSWAKSIIQCNCYATSFVRVFIPFLFCYMYMNGKKKARECISRSEVRCFWRRQMKWERRQALWLERTSWLFTCWRGWIDRAREHTLPSCTSYKTGWMIVMQTRRNSRKGCLPCAVCLSPPYRTLQSSCFKKQTGKQTLWP
jgi:hypothetical protein